MDAKQLADHEMRRSASSAEKMLRDAAQAITDERADLARKNVIELFDNAPWLAATETAVPGCLNLRYCDLYALAVLTAQPKPSAR